MALPEPTRPYNNVVRLVTPSNSVSDTGLRRDFDSLNAKAEANWRFLNALATLVDYEQSPRSEAKTMDALDYALKGVIDATSASDGALLIMDESNGDLIFALAHGETPKEKLLWQRVPAGRGVAHWAASHKRATIVNSAWNDDRFYNGVDVANDFYTRTIVAAPLLNDKEAIGVVEILNKKDGEFFSLSDQNHLTVFARLASSLLVQLRDRRPY